jgi:hypothetical protein
MNLNNSFIDAEIKFFNMTDLLKDKKMKSLDLSDIEEYIQKDGRDLLKHLLLGHIEDRGIGDIGPGVIGSDGIKRTHKRIRIKKIKTLFGKIEINRIAYSVPGVSSLFPLDAMLNLPKIDVSYNLQKYFVLEIIKTSFDESIESIERWTEVKISKYQAKKIIIESANDFSEFYYFQFSKEKREAKKLPLIILTSDGKGVVMRKEDLREATRKKSRKKKKFTKRDNIFHKDKSNSKRIATVASVYEIARFIRKPVDIIQDFFLKPESKRNTKRPRPKAKRVWASLENSSEKVINEIFEEALQRDPLNQKEWVVLVDGDLNQIKKFKKLSKKFGVKLTIICDIIHVIGYLWKAGKVLNDQDKLENWISSKLILILDGKSSFVASGIRRTATCRDLDKKTREPIDTCAKYLLNHSAYLKYNEYLKNGYPIATGIIEGACRYLVKDRMEITGARWGLKGAEAILKLRAIKISGDFQKYWKFYEQQQYIRNHKILYQDPSVIEI